MSIVTSFCAITLAGMRTGRILREKVHYKQSNKMMMMTMMTMTNTMKMLSPVNRGELFSF